MWKKIWIEPGLLEEQVTHGWYFSVYATVSYSAIIIGAILYIRFLWQVPEIHKKQSVLMAFGGIIPLLGGISLDFFGLDLIPQLDEVILLFLASTLIFSLALFRYSILSVMPVVYAQVFKSMQVGVIIINPQLLVIELNPAVKRMIDITSNRYQGTLLYNLWEQSRSLEFKPESTTEISIEKKGKTVYYSISIDSVLSRTGHLSGYIILTSDITRQRQDAMALEKLASEDGLTGLLNRRTFMDSAEMEINRSMRYSSYAAIILFDIDDFKKVNDNFGHQSGDIVLSEISQLCRRNSRSSDYLGRYGGEEFIMLTTQLERGSEVVFAEKICKNIADSSIFLPELNISINVTISVGVALFDPAEDNPDLDTLISKADKMLYQSKENGKNQVTSWPGAV